MAKRVSFLRRVATRGTNAALEASSVFARSLVFGRAEPSARDQYVQNVSARSAVIAWMSEEPGAGHGGRLTFETPSFVAGTWKPAAGGDRFSGCSKRSCNRS